MLTLDEALQDTIPALLALLDALPEDSPFLTLDPPQRRQRTLDGAQAPAAARKPGAAAAAGLRRPALDRCRDAGPARQPGREPADGPPAAAGQLPPGVPARLGQQDLLHATAARPAAAGERRRVPAGPAGGRPQPGAAQAAPDRAHRGQSLLSGGERAHPGGDRGAGRRARAPIAWRKPARPACRCPPRCRRCWRRASTGCRPRRSASSRPPPSSAPRCPCPCCRPLPSCPRRRCTVASRTSRRPSSSTRRASSPSASTPSSTPSPTRWPTAASCRSGGGRCMPASSRP